MLQWDLWRGLLWYQHWKLQVGRRCFQFAPNLRNLSECRLQVVCTFPKSHHYSWSMFKADRETHLQSLKAAFPEWWITLCCYQRAGGRDTHTPPQMQSNKTNTRMHIHIPAQIFLYLFLEIVRKRNMPSPELHKLMSFSATSQIFHRKAATNTWANKRSVSAFADPADIVYIHIN